MCSTCIDEIGLIVSQGISLTADATSFGSFSVALLDSLRDEYPRTPILGFPILSGVSLLQAPTGDVRYDTEISGAFL